MPAFRIVVGIKATSAQLVELYERMREMVIVQYSQCLWFERCRVITFLKPISVIALNNWVPAPHAPFSKMSTNALRTLSNTLISLKVRKQLWKQVLLHQWSMQQISNRNSDVPFASILCCLTTHEGLIFQSKPYRMTRLTRLIQTIQLFVRCELSTFKTIFWWIGRSFWIP